MYCNFSGRSLVAACFFAALSPAAKAGEPVSARFGKGDVVVSGTIDFLSLYGDEQVYYGPKDGRLLSRLLWDTSSAMGLTVNAHIGATDHISIYGSGTIGFLANSYMIDYDWLARDTFGIDDWTDRSRSPNTVLDHYYALDIGARFKVYENQNSDAGLIAGLRYTDVKWSSYGGDYIYSGCFNFPDDCYFREDTGNFSDDLRLITYQQKFPAIYTGIATAYQNGNWSWDTTFKIGATVGGKDIDHHWLRDLLFTEKFKPGLYLGSDVQVAYQLRDNIKLTLGAHYDYYGLMKGSTTFSSIATGEVTGPALANSAGAAFKALRLSAGLKAKF
jgi:outer membrane protease